jgi:hypothetical protein
MVGRLPAEKVGRDWLIKEGDLDKFIPLPRGRPSKKHKSDTDDETSI